MKILMFISTVVILLTVLTYVYYRLVFKFARSWGFFFLYILLSINVIVSRILPDMMPLQLLRAEGYLSGLWLAVLFYSLLIAVIHLILYCMAKLFGLRLPNEQISLGMLGCCFIFCLWGAWCAFHPDIRYERLQTEKLAVGTKVKVGLVSDIHLGRVLVRGYSWDLVDLLNSQNPDVVIIAGDMLDEKISYVKRANSLEPFSHLNAPLGVYMVMGNHDYIDDPVLWQKMLKRIKINVLHGKSVALINGTLKITGLVDFSRDGGTEALRQLSAGNEEFYSILVDHQPRRFEAAEEEGYDLYLAGHSHTGQLWPNRVFTKFMYDLDYGRVKYGRMTAIVSSGIGFWGPPIRSSVSPEIVIIEINGIGTTDR